MKQSTAVILGASALTAGGILLFLRKREQGVVAQTGLVATPYDPLATRTEMVGGVPRQDPSAEAVVEARRQLIMFCDAYNRYHHHRLPADLTQMEACVRRVQGPDFDWITRRDIWAYTDYDWLLQKVEAYHGHNPSETLIYRYQPITLLRDLENGTVCYPRTHHTSWTLSVRSLMQLMRDEARSNNTIACGRAAMLPNITRMMGWGPDSNSPTPGVSEWMNWWKQRGRQIVQCGSVQILGGIYGSWMPMPIWCVR